jgi:hypothetical protein
VRWKEHERVKGGSPTPKEEQLYQPRSPHERDACTQEQDTKDRGYRGSRPPLEDIAESIEHEQGEPEDCHAVSGDFISLHMIEWIIC